MSQELEDKDVLVEKIEFVFDVMDDKLTDLMWSRATVPQGWVLYAEEYSEERPSGEHRFVHREVLLDDSFTARILYDGLRQRIKK